MLNRQWIGNDIVDLKDPQAQGKAGNIRFLARVCAGNELLFVGQALDPHVALWTLWSIKEASYKAFQKFFPASQFIPNQLICEEAASDVWRCRFLEMLCHVKVCINADFVHAIARVDGGVGSWDGIVFRTDMLLPGAAASEAVRQLVVEMLSERGYQGCTIVRAVQNQIELPPEIHMGKHRLPNSDISLSHDGRYIAAALWL